MKFSFYKVAAAAVTASALAPGVCRACACGCGVFDVGTSSMLPQGPGGMFFTEYDYQDQYMNYHGSSKAPGEDNSDKEIRTHFITTGLQYFFNRSWGLQVEVPYDLRYFRAATDSGGTTSVNWSSLGDIRLEGFYTGFSEDMSSGVTFGLKLPTGNYTFDPDIVDRDTQLGTGSTDLLMGGFYRTHLTRNMQWSFFSQVQADLPVLTRDQYVPGFEIDGSAGIYYSGWIFGRLSLTPIGQIIASERTRDCGNEASGGELNPGPPGSGYQRILLSPGLEFDIHPFSIYADVELPVYEHVRGDQLVAPALFKLIVSYHF